MRHHRVPIVLASVTLVAAGGVTARAATDAPAAGKATDIVRTAGLNPDERLRARNAVALLDGIFNKHQPRETITRYISAKGYIQHNPSIVNGRDTVIQAFEGLAKALPDSQLTFRRVVAQGDLVVVHGVQKTTPEDRGTVELDIFRFDKRNKIVEHWDVLQPVAETSVNGNPQA